MTFKQGKKALSLLLCAILLILTAACGSGHRGSLAIYAGSWLQNDAVCLRLLSTTWPNGSYESCKYSCRGREDFRKKLQAAVDEADTGRNGGSNGKTAIRTWWPAARRTRSGMR